MRNIRLLPLLEAGGQETLAKSVAKKLGLSYAGWGRWADKSGAVVAKTVDGKLVKMNAPEQNPSEPHSVDQRKTHFIPQKPEDRQSKQSFDQMSKKVGTNDEPKPVASNPNQFQNPKNRRAAYKAVNNYFERAEHEYYNGAPKDEAEIQKIDNNLKTLLNKAYPDINLEDIGADDTEQLFKVNKLAYETEVPDGYVVTAHGNSSGNNDPQDDWDEEIKFGDFGEMWPYVQWGKDPSTGKESWDFDYNRYAEDKYGD